VGDVQSTPLEATQNYLRDSFIAHLQHAVTSSLDRIGKGWFNIHERSHDMYAHSKLRRLLNAIRFMMEDTVRSLVLQSVQAYTTFTDDVCQHSVCIQSTCQICVDHEQSCKRAPLLSVSLQPLPSGIEYSDDIDSLPQQLSDLMLRSVAACQGLPQLEPLVLTKMTWAYKPKLAGVKTSEDVIQMAAKHVHKAWTAAVDVMRTYRAQFAHFEQLLQQDNEAVVNSLLAKGDELNLADVCNALAAAEKELDCVKHEIPQKVWAMCRVLRGHFSYPQLLLSFLMS
jgi:dynein heavy chain, axonemal